MYIYLSCLCLKLTLGYVLKRDMKKEEEGEKISMEQLVEEERANLLKNLPAGKVLTKVTEETFKAWKRKKVRCFVSHVDTFNAFNK